MGGEKTKELHRKLNTEKIAEYNKSPSKCINCDTTLSYNKRFNKFCNRKCSASYNNLISKNNSLVEWKCLYCNKSNTTLKWKIGTYCNAQCHKLHIRAARVKDWLENDVSWHFNIPGWAKEYISELYGYKCSECGISEWNNKPILLECDHIDGNHSNNKPSNLRLICPNCHSQTPTYKNKNKGNGRQHRRTIKK